MIHQTCMRFYGKIGYDTQYGGTGEMGDESSRLAQRVAGKQILVMGNHGILGIGKSAGEVFDNLYYFERAAMLHVITFPVLWTMESSPKQECLCKKNIIIITRFDNDAPI